MLTTLIYRLAFVIDDSHFDQYLAARMIKNTQLAAQVNCLDSGYDALVLLESLRIGQWPEVIFVDLQMSAMNGFDFLDEYLQFPVEMRQQSKIVMMSSTLENEDFERMKNYPVIRRFLAKPFSEGMFRELIL